MIKKYLMIFLILCFVAGIFSLSVYFLKNKNPMSTVLNVIKPTEEPEPTLAVSLIPTVVDPYVQKGQELREDLNKIIQDCDKVRIEDSRLIPPVFYTETQVTE